MCCTLVFLFCFFKKEVFNLVGDEYTVLGDYVNNKVKILMRHNVCGNEYTTRPNDFQQGHRCPICLKNSKESLIVA